jgi:hypothetical protein
VLRADAGVASSMEPYFQVYVAVPMLAVFMPAVKLSMLALNIAMYVAWSPPPGAAGPPDTDARSWLSRVSSGWSCQHWRRRATLVCL